MKTEKASGEASPSSNMSNAAAVPLTSRPAQTHAADPEGSNEHDFHTDSLSMGHVRSIELLLQTDHHQQIHFNYIQRTRDTPGKSY